MLDTFQPEPAITLRTAFWPAVGQTRGRVLLLQGLAEFIEKYAHVAAALTARGFAVYSFDWRGQGGSTRGSALRRQAHVPDFGAYVRDLLALHRHWFGTGPAPLLLAHSMGGHLALRALSGNPALFKAGVLTAPMLGVRTVPWPPAMARAVAWLGSRLGGARRYIPGGPRHDLRRVHFADNPYTSDAAQFAAVQQLMRAHPDKVVRAASVGWLNGAFESLATLHRQGVADAITTPLSLVLAGDDRVVVNAPARRFAARLTHARVVEIPNARHELLLEQPAARARLWAEIDLRFDVAGT